MVPLVKPTDTKQQMGLHQIFLKTCLVKETWAKTKTLNEWEKMFTLHTSGKGLVTLDVSNTLRDQHQQMMFETTVCSFLTE